MTSDPRKPVSVVEGSAPDRIQPVTFRFRRFAVGLVDRLDRPVLRRARLRAISGLSDHRANQGLLTHHDAREGVLEQPRKDKPRVEVGGPYFARGAAMAAGMGYDRV